MAVFSLQEVNKLQVKNKSDGNYINWSEGGSQRNQTATSYVYHQGGQSYPTPASPNCYIRRFDFSTATHNYITTRAEKSRTNHWAVTAPPGDYGYFAGGSTLPTDSPNVSCTIIRFDYSTEIVSYPGNDMPVHRSGSFVANDVNYAFMLGGFSPSLTPLVQTSYNRFDFTTEANSVPTTYYPNPAGVGYGDAVSSEKYGYFVGGYSPSPAIYSTVNKLDFSSETSTQISNDINRSDGVSFGNRHFGYIATGVTDAPPVGETKTSKVSRIEFENDTISTRSNFGSTIAYSTASPNNISEAFVIGGKATNASADVRAYDMATETDSSNQYSSAPGYLLYPQILPGGLLRSASMSGFAIKRSEGYGNTAYYASGYRTVPNVAFLGAWNKMELDTETHGLNNPSIFAVTTAHVLEGHSNSKYGYAGGCRRPPQSPFYWCYIKRLDFTTDSDLVMGEMAAPGIMGEYSRFFNNYYKATRFKNGFTSVEDLEYATETLTYYPEPATFTPAPQGNDDINTLTTQSAQYGYITNGWVNPVFGEKKKKDFANDTFSIVPGAPYAHDMKLATPMFNYEVAGPTSIKKFSFDTDTASSLPNAPANVPAYSNMGFSASPSIGYGYSVAGYLAPSPTNYTSYVIRLNFNTDTWDDRNPTGNYGAGRQGGFTN